MMNVLEQFMQRFFGREDEEEKRLREMAEFQAQPPRLAFVPPPTPEGWVMLPLASSEFVSYQVEAPCESKPGSLGSEHGGVNATEFHGFPPGTLSIGSVGVFMGGFDPSGGLVLRIRFDYRPDGWRRAHAAPIPACEFRNLPWRLT